MNETIAIVVGTRPEIIKTALLPRAIREHTGFIPKIIFTGQHRSMAEQAFEAFGIKPDIDLGLMTPRQTPVKFLATLLEPLTQALHAVNARGVLVQGDTTTALGAALAAFHEKIPVAHVEAGLRTKLRYSPFPEEMNRTVVSRLADIHLCPTSRASARLKEEGICEHVYITGNTVVDALLEIQTRLHETRCVPQAEVSQVIALPGRMVLVTGHRRENFDGPLKNLCMAIRKLVTEFPDVIVAYPVHLNPRVQETVREILRDHPRVILLEPVDYPSLVALLERSMLVVTDSGGIQEEAPSFRRRVLVTRESTERPEAIEAGCARLLSTDDPDGVFAVLVDELEDPVPFPAIQGNPYGDGTASPQIAKILAEKWHFGATR